MIWGNTPKSFPPAFSLQRLRRSAARTLLFTAQRHVHRAGRDRRGRRRWRCCSGAPTLGLQMRAAAFAPEVARLLGVRVGRMFTARAGRWPRWPARWPACWSRRRCSWCPTASTRSSSAASPPPCSAGWTARRERSSAGWCSGWRCRYVVGYAGSALVPLAALVILVAVLMVRPGGLFAAHGAAGVSATGAGRAAPRWTLIRSLALVAVAGLVLLAGQRVGQRLPRPPARHRRLLLRRARRADRADRPERSDLARARRADGDRARTRWRC